jgi:hypothetical protein
VPRHACESTSPIAQSSGVRHRAIPHVEWGFQSGRVPIPEATGMRRAHEHGSSAQETHSLNEEGHELDPALARALGR